MQADDHIGSRRAGHADPFTQSNEDIVIAGQHDVITPAPDQFVAKLAGHGQGDVLFPHPPPTRQGTRINPAMAGIQHHHALALGAFGLGPGRRHEDRRARTGRLLGRRRGLGRARREDGTGNRLDIDDEAPRTAPGRRDMKGLVDQGRLLEIEHQARLAGDEQAEAIAADEPGPALAVGGIDAPGDVGKIHHDTIGIGQLEGGHRQLGIGLQHDPQLVGMDTDPDIADR